MKGKAHIVGSVAVLVVVAALAVAPSGLAAGGTSPDAFERAVNAHNASLPNPDAFERAVSIRQQISAPAFGPAASGPDLVVQAEAPIAGAGSSFDWNAAAIGGSATLAFVLLIGTIVVATRQVRHRAVAH